MLAIALSPFFRTSYRQVVMKAGQKLAGFDLILMQVYLLKKPKYKRSIRVVSYFELD